MSRTELDPTEFTQAERRLFIDTNIFMDNHSRWTGGLKRLFERTAPTIVAQRNPIVVPTKVVRELEKYAGKHSSHVAEEQVEAVRRSRIALTFLEDAETKGLVRTDLGDDSARYADDSFLRVVEWAGDRYEMCVVTDDITLQLRIRLRSAQLAWRLVAGTLTSDGFVVIEDDQTLYGRNARKLDAKQQKVDDGTATFADRQDVDELKELLPQAQAAFGLQSWVKRAPRTAGQGAASNGLATASISAGHVAKPFSKSARFRGPDQPLSAVQIPSEGESIISLNLAGQEVVRLGVLLGEGGEGRVYEIEGQPTRVAKIFDKDSRTEHRRSKLDLMLSRGLSREGVAFPIATLATTDGDFLGYIMPRASGRELQRTVTNPGRFRKAYPTWTKSDLVDVCVSFLEKVSYLHSLNILVGDINPKNVMVDSSKVVWIIDADSWQLEGYPCAVGTPMFTAPTVTGEYASRLRTMQEENFAVATMLFNILMTGQYPYARTGADTSDPSDLIAGGKFPYQFQGASDRDQPEGNWKFMWSHLPFPVKSLFWNTFHRDGKRYERRPSAAEWLQAFREYSAFFGGPDDFDPMSNEVYPFRFRAFRPDTPIRDCPQCERSNAIVGQWDEDTQSYYEPMLCYDCNQTKTTCGQCGKRKPASALIYGGRCWDCYQKSDYAECANCIKETRTKYLVNGLCSNCQLVACSDCRTPTPKSQLTYGRCPACQTKQAALDPARLCTRCGKPFITYGNVAWHQRSYKPVPTSHKFSDPACTAAAASRISQSSSSRTAAGSGTSATARAGASRPQPQPAAAAKKGLWARIADWFWN